MGRESIFMIFYFPKNLISNSPKTAHFHFWEVFLGKWGKQQNVPYKEVLQGEEEKL
jgi:hypothetical protein